MALVKSTSQLDAALAEFNGKLTSDEKTRFRALPTGLPDASAVMTLTAQLDRDAEKRRGRCIASRLFAFLTSVQQFSGVVGTFVSSNPAVAALVWGSVQFMLQLAKNSFSYFDQLSHFLIEIGKLCPRFKEYQTLYHDVPALQSVLSDFYAEIIRCCTHVCDVLRRRDWLNLVRSAWSPFDTEFAPFRAKIKALSHDVKEEIKLAAARIMNEELKVQRKHRQLLANSIQQDEERRLRKQKRAEVNRRQNLLDALSTYDQNVAFGQAVRKRHRGTAEWLVETQEFKDWMSLGTSAVFWLSGKLGCGKTVLLSNAVEFLLLQRLRATRIAYFFCRPDEELSLQATTILRSIARQCLSADLVDDKIEAILTDIQNKPLAQPCDLTQLLGTVLHKKFVVIDGLDACAEADRRALYSVLNQILHYPGNALKIVISSRSTRAAAFLLTTSLVESYGVLVDDSTVATDVEAYVANELVDRQQNGDFVLTDPTLVSRIELALINGAKGMFLWVALQMDEICRQDCDQDIRAAIASLPQTLEETYQRMLDRISKRQRSKRARDIFAWIIAAKRPLTLIELREALAVEKYSNYSKPERLINDITQVMSWCEGFVVHDEVSGEVAFAHPTMKLSLLQHYATVPHDAFSLADADKEAGEICVTYLNFNDFKMQLIKRSAGHNATSAHVLNASVRTSDLGQKMMKPLQRIILKSAPASPNLGRLLQSQDLVQAGVAKARDEEHPFMDYAAEHWLTHSSGFEPTDRIWPAWHRLLAVEDEAGLIRRRWTASQWSERGAALRSCIVQNDYATVLQAVQLSHNAFNLTQLDEILRNALTCGKPRLLAKLCKNTVAMPLVNRLFLTLAGRDGNVQSLKMLLDAGADVNARGGRYGNALQAACTSYENEETITLLLNAGADVNIQGGWYGTALQAACSLYGDEETISPLLNAGANVNARRGEYEITLQETCTTISVSQAKLLLEAGADVNIQGGRYGTALQAACTSHGDAEMIRLLLNAGADVNATGGEHGTALQAACIAYGDEERVRLLINAGANVNAQGGFYGNALQAACTLRDYSQQKDIVKLLLDAGANVNAGGGQFGSALQAACVFGSKVQDVTKMLLDAGADVNIQGGEYGSALEAARILNHRKALKLLQDAGARPPL